MKHENKKSVEFIIKENGVIVNNQNFKKLAFF